MKRAILITISVLFVLGLIGYSAYVYEYYRQPKPTLTAAQAIKERDQAVQTMQIHDATNRRNLDSAENQLSATSSKLTQACTALKTTKVTSPACP